MRVARATEPSRRASSAPSSPPFPFSRRCLPTVGRGPTLPSSSWPRRCWGPRSNARSSCRCRSCQRPSAACWVALVGRAVLAVCSTALQLPPRPLRAERRRRALSRTPPIPQLTTATTPATARPLMPAPLPSFPMPAVSPRRRRLFCTRPQSMRSARCGPLSAATPTPGSASTWLGSAPRPQWSTRRCRTTPSAPSSICCSQTAAAVGRMLVALPPMTAMPSRTIVLLLLLLVVAAVVLMPSQGMASPPSSRRLRRPLRSSQLAPARPSGLFSVAWAALPAPLTASAPPLLVELPLRRAPAVAAQLAVVRPLLAAAAAHSRAERSLAAPPAANSRQTASRALAASAVARWLTFPPLRA